MTMQSRAVRAGGLQFLLLMGLTGCGGPHCQATTASGEPAARGSMLESPPSGSAASNPPLEQPPTPTAALPPATHHGEGTGAGDPAGSGTVAEGSGIPPGVPDEGSPAEDLVAQLCAKLAPGDTCDPNSAMDYGSVEGGTNGTPRTFSITHGGGCHDDYTRTVWTEKPDGTWGEGVDKSYTHPAPTFEQVFLTSGTHWDAPLKDFRPASDAQITTAQAELSAQNLGLWRVGFIDLNRDGQTEAIEWTTNYCETFATARVYSRGQDGRWNKDSVATETYFGTDWPEDE
jgi:hypothetical protein